MLSPSHPWFPGASAVETDDFERVDDFTRVTIRWKFQRPEDRDKMGGPGTDRAASVRWENVDTLIEKGTYGVGRCRGTRAAQ